METFCVTFREIKGMRYLEVLENREISFVNTNLLGLVSNSSRQLS